MRGRRTVWAVTTVVVVASASLAAAATPSISTPARVADRAVRLDPTFAEELTPEQRAVAEMVTLVNVERGNRGLPFLRLDDRVATAAQAHAADMASMGSMQHLGSDGSDGGVRLTRAGFEWASWAENVGAGLLDPATLFAAWMDSAGHRANLLGDFTEVGVGVVSSPDGVPYWSLLVARAAVAP